MGEVWRGCADQTYVHSERLGAKSLLKTLIQLELGHLRTQHHPNSPFLWRPSYPHSTLPSDYTSDGTCPLAPPHCQPLYPPTGTPRLLWSAKHDKSQSFRFPIAGPRFSFSIPRFACSSIRFHREIDIENRGLAIGIEDSTFDVFGAP